MNAQGVRWSGVGKGDGIEAREHQLQLRSFVHLQKTRPIPIARSQTAQFKERYRRYVTAWVGLTPPRQSACVAVFAANMRQTNKIKSRRCLYPASTIFRQTGAVFPRQSLRRMRHTSPHAYPTPALALVALVIPLHAYYVL